MAHFAQLDPNFVVTQVIVVSNEVIGGLEFPASEPIGVNFCKSLFPDSTFWVQTSYNGSFRKCYAGVGYTYDIVTDQFIPPQPYSSWVFNSDRHIWEPPIPYPADDKQYMWDEQTISWISAGE